MTPESLETAWTELLAATSPTREFTSRRFDAARSPDIHIAIRGADGAPCLLVDLPDGAAADEGFEVGGMRLHRAGSEGRQLLVLSLEERARRDIFAKVCADVVNAAAAAGPSAWLRELLERLAAWRAFLRDVSSTMPRFELVGLIGELRILARILEREPTATPSWKAPADGIHDFELGGHAIEVKASVGVGRHIRISRLDQLDDVGLRRLHLVHVHMAEDDTGPSLRELVEEVEALLPDEAARRVLANALLRRGLGPDDEIARDGLRTSVAALGAWAVGEGFPRLIRSGLQPAIVEAEYVLDPRALAPWSVALDDLLGDFCGVTTLD